MSSTSSSCTSVSSRPYCARAGGLRLRFGVATNTAPSGPYQAGMRCPHQSWRLMHQGWMSRIQAKNVFSHCFGTNTVRPALHGRDRRRGERLGVGIPLRGQQRLDRHLRPVAMRHLVGVRLRLHQQLQPLQLGHDRLAGDEPVLPGERRGPGRVGDAGTAANSISASVTRASRSSTDGIGRSWRRPTSKSLKSCAGVILTAPVPFSGSEYVVGHDRDAPPGQRHDGMRPTSAA